MGSFFCNQTTGCDHSTSYDATNLLSGFSVNSSTGLISGAPMAAGSIMRDSEQTPQRERSLIPFTVNGRTVRGEEGETG